MAQQIAIHALWFAAGLIGGIALMVLFAFLWVLNMMRHL
jgi:hypothetical protein